MHVVFYGYEAYHESAGRTLKPELCPSKKAGRADANAVDGDVVAALAPQPQGAPCRALAMVRATAPHPLGAHQPEAQGAEGWLQRGSCWCMASSGERVSHGQKLEPRRAKGQGHGISNLVVTPQGRR